MSNLHCATTLELNLCGKDFSPTTATESISQWMQLPHRWSRLSDLSTQSALKIKITELLFPDPWLRYGVQSTVWAVYCSAQPVLWWSDVQNTGDTMCKYKVQIQCRQFTVVLSRYYSAGVNVSTDVWAKNTDSEFTHDRFGSPTLHTLNYTLKKRTLSDPA